MYSTVVKGHLGEAQGPFHTTEFGCVFYMSLFHMRNLTLCTRNLGACWLHLYRVGWEEEQICIVEDIGSTLKSGCAEDYSLKPYTGFLVSGIKHVNSSQPMQPTRGQHAPKILLSGAPKFIFWFGAISEASPPDARDSHIECILLQTVPWDVRKKGGTELQESLQDLWEKAVHIGFQWSEEQVESAKKEIYREAYRKGCGDALERCRDVEAAAATQHKEDLEKEHMWGFEVGWRLGEEKNKVWSSSLVETTVQTDTPNPVVDPGVVPMHLLLSRKLTYPLSPHVRSIGLKMQEIYQHTHSPSHHHHIPHEIYPVFKAVFPSHS
ncbi:hypothetical protein DFH08DRAFT_802360 [Mycena albidolilacea]|uniref:Uncharacterized protein n=1 Tax=Mycena albidolilacea TaxID=1033008 RepID=A0AAD7AHE3_9AGAR|nr:hypothetical protein DFH08DRAFT_802360 [Mycena albidolilacea]